MKKIRKRKYMIVFSMTVVIFLFGLMIGSFLATEKLADVRTLQENLRSDTLDLEITYSLLEQEPCEYFNTAPIVDQLQNVAERVDYLESQLGKKDENVLQLKKYYSLLQLRQWMFEERVKDECAPERTVILYFYNNEPGACPSCEEQGFILSYIRNKYEQNVSVYSFDVQTESESLQAIIRRYNITEVPAVVVDEKILSGFQTTDALEELVDPLPNAVRDLLIQ